MVAYEKLIVPLSSGKLMSKEDIETYFRENNDDQMIKTMYRLSANLYMLKRFRGAVIKTKKDGRKVVGYQLVNHKDYDPGGEWLKKYINKDNY